MSERERDKKNKNGTKRNSDTQGERESFKCTDSYRDKNINYNYRN